MKEEYREMNLIRLDQLKKFVKDLYVGHNRSTGHEKLAELLFEKVNNIPVGEVRNWFKSFESLEKLPTMKTYNDYINSYHQRNNEKINFKQLELEDKWYPDQTTKQAIERCINVAKKFYISNPDRYLKAKENLLKDCPYLAVDFQEEDRDLKKIGAEHRADALFENKKNRGLFMLGEYIESSLRSI